MSLPLHCSSCCLSCFCDTPPRMYWSPPYTRESLLGLGTVSLNIPAVAEHQICDHVHADDNWHNLQMDRVLPLLCDSEEIAFCQGLDFLIKKHFIVATRRNNDHIGKMDIRIYLIPYDLPSAQGKLRLRKESILGPARRYMRALLPRVSQDVARWNGSKPAGGDLPIAPDPRSLADIYSDLASPQPIPTLNYGNIMSRLLDFQDNLDGLEMRSTLHHYQRRSIAAMIQKELNLQDVPDPLYIPIKTIHDEIFYIQPGTTEVLREVPLSATCRGGILCEELGTGKTVMMLGLILATRQQISTPEPSLVDDRPVMTQLAYQNFPSSEYSTARKRAGDSNPEEKVPSLVELMLHRSRTAPFADLPSSSWSRRHIRNVTVEEEINTLPLGKMLQATVPFYHHYLGEPHNRERSHRVKQPKAPKPMYLTSATLVIVPANLLSQWHREIQKHCAYPLRVFIIRAKTHLPSVQSLATDYDVILMSYTSFSAQSTKNNVQRLHVHQSCKCPSFSNYNVPKCSCQVSGVSPFLQIRWKRLVIDEGHVSSSLSTNLVPFAKTLSVERRWIVTGTPTTNLLGLSLGNKSAVDTDKSGTPDNIPETDLSVPGNQSTDVQSRQHLPSPSPTLSTAVRNRTWNKYDREDLNKLGNMITHFIAVPQFSAEPKLVSTHIIEPLLDPQGPRAGAIQVLNQVMVSIMVRHRIDDVERDVALPALKQEAVLLDLDPLVVLSFNALQASIIINAVDSERRDQDYLFHPTNADLLQDTVKNMSQILFWHANSDLYNADEMVKASDEIIDRAMKRNMPQQDIDAAREAFEHLQKAVRDPIWKYLQTHEDVPYRVYHLDELVYDAWTRIPRLQQDSQADFRLAGLLHADMLVGMDELLVKRPLIPQEDMIQIGTLMLQRDKVARQAYEKAQRKRSRRKSKGSSDDMTTSQLVEKFAKKASSIDTLSEIQKELSSALARLEQEDENESPSTLGPSTPEVSPTKQHSNLVASSHAKISIGSSLSSKLNYIINEIDQYSKNEKFLIFSESPLTLSHVAEALEIKHVKFLRFTTQVPPQIREQLVLTFETSETYRVFLMELKHGARGLNLVSASRVIFCEPVWQADVESQAIKRAHRIGQVRPISVKTLAIRQTAEENMVARRSALKDSHEKLPKVLEEAGMRHYIANPKFITRAPETTSINEFPLVDVSPERRHPRSGALTLKIPPLTKSPKRVRVEDVVSAGSSSKEAWEDEPPKKKKELSVRFT